MRLSLCLGLLGGIVAGIVVACIPLGPARAAGDAAVTAIRFGRHPDRFRIVLDVTKKVDTRVFTLAAPYRVVIDVPDVTWHLPPRAGEHVAGLVSGFRFGQFAPGLGRVVFDLTGPAVVATRFVLPPRGGKAWRIVIDLRRTTPEAFAAAQQTSPPIESVSARLAMFVPPPLPAKPPLVDKPVVVIDAGHGGVDPGTIARDGVYEKTITLAMAKALAEVLKDEGHYRVVLTRDDDTFIRLRGRVAIARDAGADLFISLHVNSISDSDIRGASVYTLSERSSDREAAALAARENKADLIAGIDLSAESDEVTNILIDLAQRETMNHSAKFASMVIDEVGKVTTLLRRTHRFAGFAVLKAPDVPSVLVEMGFLSNRKDEALLRSRRYQEKFARALAQAVDDYFHYRGVAVGR